jgi:uncharacterized protein (DUF1800 family)
MPTLLSLRTLCGLGLGLLLAANAARAQDLIHANGFENVLPATDAEAARFLTQASFGPSRAQIDNVRAIGYEAWIDAQMATPATLARPYLEGQEAQGLATNQPQRLNRWFYTAATAPDQLRQRVAFALSEIMVVSDLPDNLANDWQGIAEYQDMLAVNAFGSYSDVLKKVSLSPQMGKYLSHWRNRKAAGTSEPDENFAREILQLFSIGLSWRNPDFSLMTDGLGQPIPTYDQAVVTELAQVFTGFGNTCPSPPGLCNPYTGLTSIFDSYQPMACFPLYHDLSTKQLFDLDSGPAINRVVLPAGPACDPAPAPGSALETQCFAYCNNELDATITAIANHPNVAPFLARQLIQRLVTSNPSPAYVQRVAAVHLASGGNLGQVVRAILLDTEARTYDPAVPGFGQAPNFGKLREPLLRITAFWRAFGAVPGLCFGPCLDQSNPPAGLTELRMGVGSPQTEFSQRPFGAPSVFNFFEPDYLQPGAIATAGVNSPEFQILDETTSVRAANEIWYLVWAGYNSGTGAFLLPNRYAYFPTAEIDGLPTAANALLDELNLRLMYGSMSGSYTVGNCNTGTGMQGELYKLLQCAMAAAEHRRRVLGAIHLIVVSPEFMIQR